MDAHKLLEEQLQEIGDKSIKYLKSLTPLFSQVIGSVKKLEWREGSPGFSYEYTLCMHEGLTTAIPLISIRVTMHIVNDLNNLEKSPDIEIFAFDPIVHDFLAQFFVVESRKTWPSNGLDRISGSFHVKYEPGHWDYKIRESTSRFGEHSF